ncbi:MAG: PGF-pre-PGF domain-containing protein [Candidatus Woesearchaeota archaeon]
MRTATTIIVMALLLLAAASAEEYTGTATTDGVATSGNSSNYTATAGTGTVVVSGNSSNYTLEGSSYSFDADADMPPPPEDDGDDDDSSSSGSGGGTFYPSGGSEPEPAETARSFTSYADSVNDSLRVSNPRSDMSFAAMEVSVKAEVSNARIKVVEAVDAASRQETSSFDGRLYRLFDIDHDDVSGDDISSAQLSFKVDKDWLEGEGVAEDEVVLFRYDGFEWDSLETEEVDENMTFVFYEAESPGLSTFLVGAEGDDDPSSVTGNAVSENASEDVNESAAPGNESAPPQETAPEEDPYGTSSDASGGANPLWLGAGLLVVAAVVIGLVVQMKRRKSKEDEQGEGEDSKAQEEKPGEADGKQEHGGASEKEKPHDEGSGKPAVVEGSEAEAEEKPSASEEHMEEPLFVDNDEEMLTDFLRKAFEKGYLMDHLRPLLLDKGWTPAQIEHCVKKLGKD